MSDIQYVKYTEYFALKQKYDNLRLRNKELNNLIKSMSESIEIIKTTYESIVYISNSIPKVEEIKQILSRTITNTNNSTNRKEELETKTDSEMNDNKSSPSPEGNNPPNPHHNNISNNNTNVAKKIEETEAFINDMTRQYNTLVQKYKYLVEEKENSENECKGLNEKIRNFNERINMMVLENTRLQDKINKQKDNEKCLINTINDLLLDSEKISKQINVNKEISCEPMPSFVRFLNK
jgi:chromosome segregation ATPase